MIPKIIHYCWFGGNPIPNNLQRCIDSWKQIMPDYKIQRWDESNYDVGKCTYAKEAYEAKKWGFVPDYIRLDLCYTYGGIYLDVDVEVIKPFDYLLSLDGFCGLEKGKQQNFIVTNLGLAVGLAKGQEMGRIMRDDYLTLHFKKPDGSFDLTPSPIIQTRLLLKYGMKLSNIIQTINGLTIFPTEYFCPLNQATGQLNITHNTYSIHHYEASWMSPADQERRELRRKYSQRFGMVAADLISTFVAYKKHYGMIGMWNKIADKVIN
jgi:hypothetical protein